MTARMQTGLSGLSICPSACVTSPVDGELNQPKSEENGPFAQAFWTARRLLSPVEITELRW